MFRSQYKISLLLVSFFLIAQTFTIQAQKESAIWYFGNKAGLDFRNYHPYPIHDSQMNTMEGCATVSDSLGNLLFYTDGITVWGSDHQIIGQGPGLMGDPNSTNAATIIPNPNNPKQYYIFTLGKVPRDDPNYFGLNYVLVDFSTNEQGEIVSFSTEGLMANPTEKLAVYPFIRQTPGGSNVPDMRLTAHEFGSKRFAKINLSKLDSISYQEIGLDNINAPDDSTNQGAVGQIKFSLRGDRLAVAVTGQKRFEVFRVNPTTGRLSNGLYLPAGDRTNKLGYLHEAYGVEFSPTGSYLYGTSKDGVLYQWDFSRSWNQNEIKEIVYYPLAENEVRYGAMQLAPNGKIYIAVQGRDYLSVINMPNHLQCKFDRFGVRLTDNANGLGGTSEYGLPAPVPGSIPLEAFYYENTCLGDLTSFFITIKGWANNPFISIQDSASGSPVDVVNTSRVDLNWEASYQFKNPGTYRAILQGFRGGPVQYTRYITIHSAEPVMLAEQDTIALCIGTELTLDAGIGAFYEWDDTDIHSRFRTINAPIQLIQLYRVFRWDYNGCFAADTIWALRKTPPDLTTSSTKAVCGELNGTATVHIPENRTLDDFVFTWEGYPDSTSNTMSGLGPGIYHVTILPIWVGCEITKEITVSSLGGADVQIIPSDTIVCPGSPVTLEVTGADEFEWIKPAGKTDRIITVYPSKKNTYRVKATSRDGELFCESFTEKTIDVFTLTKPEIGDNQVACEGDTILLDGGGLYDNWSWSNGMSGKEIAVTQSDATLVLTTTDFNQCITMDTVSVTFFPYPEVDLGQDRSLCSSQPVELSGGTGDSYLWNTSETSQTINISQSGTYSLQITENGCVSNDTVFVKMINPDNLIFNALNTKDVNCYGESNGQIEILVSGEGSFYEYSIDDGETFREMVNRFDSLPAGDQYRVVVKEDSVCTLVYPDPVIITQPDSIWIKFRITPPSCETCEDGTIEIKEIYGGTAPFEVTWSTGTNGLLVENLSLGTYTADILDSSECAKLETFVIDIKFYVPNAFTPNGDQVNDLWTIQLLHFYPDCVVRTYDSFGKLVFESDPGYPEPWNGRFMNQGDPLPVGTYYYVILLDDVEEPLTGHLTILR